VLYRARALLAEEWQGDAKGADTTPIAQGVRVFGAPRARCCGCSTGSRRGSPRLSFAIVGDFEDASIAGARRRGRGSGEEGGEHAGIVLASGAGALGVLWADRSPSSAPNPTSGRSWARRSA
jgi:hypothetical protein